MLAADVNMIHATIAFSASHFMGSTVGMLQGLSGTSNLDYRITLSPYIGLTALALSSNAFVDRGVGLSMFTVLTVCLMQECIWGFNGSYSYGKELRESKAGVLAAIKHMAACLLSCVLPVLLYIALCIYVASIYGS